MSDLPPGDRRPDLADGIDRLADKVEGLTAAVPPDRPGLVDGLDRLADKVSGLIVAVHEESRVRGEEIDRTRDQIAAVERVDRRSRRTVGALAAFALVGALASAGVWTRSAVITCQNGNGSRVAVREAFDEYTEALAAAPPVNPRTPEEQARRDAALVVFRADIERRLAPLEPRACSLQDALFPAKSKG